MAEADSAALAVDNSDSETAEVSDGDEVADVLVCAVSLIWADALDDDDALEVLESDCDKDVKEVDEIEACDDTLGVSVSEKAPEENTLLDADEEGTEDELKRSEAVLDNDPVSLFDELNDAEVLPL
jgi:hypothetical protein